MRPISVSQRFAWSTQKRTLLPYSPAAGMGGFRSVRFREKTGAKWPNPASALFHRGTYPTDQHSRDVHRSYAQSLWTFYPYDGYDAHYGKPFNLPSE
jgi:hypothetical protein